MGTEIERKFLVQNNDWKKSVVGVEYKQGYIHISVDKTVRVRIEGSKAFLNIKGKKEGFSRKEFEYEIPIKDAEELLFDLIENPLITKKRYTIPYQGFQWQVDEFSGDNEGLVVAEIELPSENTKFDIPEWIGVEVTEDPRYYNAQLVHHPYSRWEKEM